MINFFHQELPCLRNSGWELYLSSSKLHKLMLRLFETYDNSAKKNIGTTVFFNVFLQKIDQNFLHTYCVGIQNCLWCTLWICT